MTYYYLKMEGLTFVSDKKRVIVLSGNLSVDTLSIMVEDFDSYFALGESAAKSYLMRDGWEQLPSKTKKPMITHPDLSMSESAKTGALLYDSGDQLSIVYSENSMERVTVPVQAIIDWMNNTDFSNHAACRFNTHGENVLSKARYVEKRHCNYPTRVEAAFLYSNETIKQAVEYVMCIRNGLKHRELEGYEKLTLADFKGFKEKDILTVNTIPWYVVPMFNFETGRVSFFPDIKALKRNKPVESKLGKFFKRFLPKDIEDHLIRDAVGFFTGADLKLEFLTDEDDIRRAYTDIDGSCMGGSWSSRDHHPTACYANTPDVSVAYIKGVARAVINEIDKTYYTIYGDFSRMAPKLQQAGYTSGSLGLDGCRLRKSLYSDGKYNMSYLDGEQSIHDFDDEFFIVGDSDYPEVGMADSTDGILYAERFICDCCGDREVYYATAGNGEEICEFCADNRYVYVPSEGELYPEMDCTEVDGEWYLDGTLEDHDIYEPVDDGDFYHIDHLISTEDGYLCRYESSVYEVYNIDYDCTEYYYELPSNHVEYEGEYFTASNKQDILDYIEEKEKAA